jgi:2-polyprenyl-3-methyl-5-hydroxy-6-metoxy-1,4-benzoquinol methylase
MDHREPPFDTHYSAFKQSELREKYTWPYLRFWYRGKYLPLLKGIERDAPILDIGCGSGLMLACLNQAGFTNVTGIDVSASQTHRAKARGLHALQADILRYLPRHRSQFEAVVALDVIEHFAKAEVLKVVAAVHDCLMPGGIFVIQTPNGEGLLPNYVIYGDLTHQTILSPHSLGHVLMRSGFTDIRMKELRAGAVATFPLLAGWELVRFTAMLIKFIEIGRIQKYWTESFVCWCRKPALVPARHAKTTGRPAQDTSACSTRHTSREHHGTRR